jgi:hypothetical protein
MEGMARQLDGANFASEIFTPLGYWFSSNPARTLSPAVVLAAAIG